MEAFQNSTQKRIWGMSWQMLLSISFAVMALVLAILFPLLDYKWFCVAGMGLSLLGDILLTPNSIFSKLYKGDLFVFGGAAFLFAHLFYAQGFLQKATMFGGISFWRWVVLGLFFAVGMAFLVPSHILNPEKNTPLFLCITLYLLVICYNVGTVFGGAFAAGQVKDYLAFFGIVSFYVSDIILLCGVVGKSKVPYYDQWIWIFYPIGQFFLIAFA